jgi:hypothetical protein
LYFKNNLRLGIIKPDFYGDVVYKLSMIMGRSNFIRGYDPVILKQEISIKKIIGVNAVQNVS